jgi:receptor expression-enhancing protein 1/2/3/4
MVGFGPPQPTPTAGASVSRTSSSEFSDVRQRSGRTSAQGGVGRFEEVEVPSDIEDEQGFIPTAGEDGPTLRPIKGRQTSWFGGWNDPNAAGYERVKTD